MTFFTASGDLRHFMKTVNELPEDYNGSLRVILNDKQPVICLRNLMLLITLAKADSIPKAAEIALHLWYSAFVQSGHSDSVLSILREFLPTISRPTFKLQLGDVLTINASFSAKIAEIFALMTAYNLDTNETRAEMDRVL